MSRDHRSAAAAMPSTAREQAAEANTRRRVLNLQELNRSWWKLVRNISGVNFVVGMFVAFVVVFQINAQGKPELMEAVHALGCAACASMLLSQTITRLVIIRSLCARGRRDAGSKYVAWASQLESGVLATLLSENLQDARALGTPAQVAHAGMQRCRAVRLSSLGPRAFAPGEQRSESDQARHSFACLRPDFFISRTPLHRARLDRDMHPCVQLNCGPSPRAQTRGRTTPTTSTVRSSSSSIVLSRKTASSLVSGLTSAPRRPSRPPSYPPSVAPTLNCRARGQADPSVPRRVPAQVLHRPGGHRRVAALPARVRVGLEYGGAAHRADLPLQALVLVGDVCDPQHAHAA